MSFGWMVSAAAFSSHRTVVVIGAAGDPPVEQQQVELRQAAAALVERDAIVKTLTPAQAARRAGFGVSARTGFAVLLIGKDGEVKLRAAKPVAVSEILALIDSMPMRQEEMRRRK